MILSKEELNTARNIVRNITKSFTVPSEEALEIEDQVTKIVRSHNDCIEELERANKIIENMIKCVPPYMLNRINEDRYKAS
jgi:hypothetical protein